MPRSPKLSESPQPEDDIYGSSPAPRRALNDVRQQPRPQRQQVQQSSLSPSPTLSSDKENPSSRGDPKKGKGRAEMPPPKLPTPLSDGDRNGKRRRQTESDPNPRQSQRPRASTEAEDAAEVERPDTEYYNPDQDPEERRHLRKGFRDLAAEINENRADYLKSDNTDLPGVFKKANKLSKLVKQTADATIDSRLLVTAADLAYRRSCQLTNGDSVQGVDLDEFITKCISFMKSGSQNEDIPATQPSSTQSQGRGRRRTNAAVDDDEGDDGDELNWKRLGQLACLQHNSRPSVPGFLLGPLSLEKKARKATQRIARLKPSQYTQTQPVTLKAGDFNKDETKNLTYLTKMIHQSLKKSQKERYKAASAIHDRTPNMSISEGKKLYEEYGLVFPKGGLNLWQFVVNPRSFGQTVENIFYVSFLIRDGKARLSPDDDGQLGLYAEEPANHEEQRSKNSTKYQGIISIDMSEWQTLVDIYDIKESMIEHREEEEESAGLGWV